MEDETNANNQLNESKEEMKLKIVNLDMDKLFSLSYTFDNLKLFMNTLLENQSTISKKINGLQNEFNRQKEELKNNYSSLEKKIKFIEYKPRQKNAKNILPPENTGKNNIEEKQPRIKKEEIKRESIIEKKIEKTVKEESKENRLKLIEQKQIEEQNKASNNQVNQKNDELTDNEEEEDSPIIEDDYNNNFYIDNQEIEEMKEKIEKIERRLSTIELNSKMKTNKIINTDNNSQELHLLKLQIKDHETKIEDLNKQKDDIKNTLDEISVKVLDFNVVDLLGSNKNSEGSVETTKVLLLNLEQKFFKKSNILEEKIKKNEDDMYSTKKEFQKLKNDSEIASENLNNFKKITKDLEDRFTKANEDNSSLVNDLSYKLNEIHKKLLKKCDDTNSQVKKSIEKIKAQLKNIPKKEIKEEIQQKPAIVDSLSDSDIKYIADLNKRINEIEKQIKIIYHNLDFTKTKEDIAKIENELSQKINQKDFYELSDNVNIQLTAINNLKETQERSNELSNKTANDVNFIVRKLESVNANVVTFKEALEALSGAKRENIFDPNRYLDIISFNDFIKSYKKDLEKIDFRIEDIKKLFNEMTDIVKKKASEDDMKNYESFINSKLEEIKLSFLKKFADRFENAKNFKYIESQIKHLASLCMKKIEKPESWLIAKKPVNGYHCASCESYIGDLKDKNDFLVWNKYPNRDKEKSYRIGNGFSHMLSMLNMDIKFNSGNISRENKKHKENNYEYDSDDDFSKNPQMKNASRTNIGGNVFNRSNMLPRIYGIKNEDVSNNTADNIDGIGSVVGDIERNYEEGNNDSNTMDAGNRPHIVKIYKKNKFSAPDIKRSSFKKK